MQSKNFPWLSQLSEPLARDFVLRMGGVLRPDEEDERDWQDVMGDVDEVIATYRELAEGFSEEPASDPLGPVEPPYIPKFVKDSIVRYSVQGKPSSWGAQRFRVMVLRQGHYLLKPLSSGEHDLLWATWKEFDEHASLEWIDSHPRMGMLVPGEPTRTVTAQELIEKGLAGE